MANTQAPHISETLHFLIDHGRAFHDESQVRAAHASVNEAFKGYVAPEPEDPREVRARELRQELEDLENPNAARIRQLKAEQKQLGVDAE